MSSQIIPVEEFDLVVFGGTGDLAQRKLIPALYHRHRDGQIVGKSRIIAVSRRPLSQEEYIAKARAALEEFLRKEDHEQEVVDAFIERLSYISVDVTNDAGWQELKKTLDLHPDRVRAFYLAVAPGLFGQICEYIGKTGLITDKTRVVIEKPIGKDLASARELNDAIGRVFKEEQIYRIDHYLGKETVQNLMALRFANALFEPIWNSSHIDHVQITVAESIGVGTRGPYYDTSGAMRDMVQNHILQLLCLVAMEPPMSMNADAVRDEKLKVLRALEPITAETSDKLTVRGQYTSGAGPEGAVPGYLDELEDEKS
ncbi:MAG: glucose-6-phosphate dehydrogenase (NADP(+)), partial [Rhizobiales bacterium]|nr:glucose-6-phosphate dehydrogenase (NADP(+)) [Hyphomicrobiales bacterium]